MGRVGEGIEVTAVLVEVHILSRQSLTRKERREREGAGGWGGSGGWRERGRKEEREEAGSDSRAGVRGKRSECLFQEHRPVQDPTS